MLSFPCFYGKFIFIEKIKLIKFLQYSIISIFLFFFLRLEAQTYFGLRGGVNFANVSTTKDGSISKERVVGGNVALYFDFPVGSKIAIQPEVNFIQKGYKEERYLTRLNYWDATVLLKYKYNMVVKRKVAKKKEKFIVYAIAGPYVGEASSGKRKDLIFGGVEDIRFRYRGEIQKFNLGMLFGGGLYVPFSRRGNWVFDIRYNLGLSNLNESIYSSGWLRNRGIIINVGYAIRIGR